MGAIDELVRENNMKDRAIKYLKTKSMNMRMRKLVPLLQIFKNLKELMDTKILFMILIYLRDWMRGLLIWRKPRITNFV